MSDATEQDWPLTRIAASAFDELDMCDSTNACLLSRPNPEPFSIIVSRNQTNGIGRHGRRWISPPNDSLAVSLFFPGWHDASLAGVDDRSSWVPLLAGVAAIEALKVSTSVSFALKWPNDVLFEQRKLAGILTQFHPSGGYVIGLGLNVYRSAAFPSINAVSLGEVTELSQDFEDLFVSSFILSLQEKVSLGLSSVAGLVKEVLDTLGRVVNVEEIGKSPWVGKALDLGPRGELVVINQEGASILVQAADVWHVRAADA